MHHYPLNDLSFSPSRTAMLLGSNLSMYPCLTQCIKFRSLKVHLIYGLFLKLQLREMVIEIIGPSIVLENFKCVKLHCEKGWGDQPFNQASKYMNLNDCIYNSCLRDLPRSRLSYSWFSIQSENPIQPKLDNARNNSSVIGDVTSGSSSKLSLLSSNLSPL